MSESMEGCPMAYSTTSDDPAILGGDSEELIKLLVGRRARRNRLRRLLLAKLIRATRAEETDTGEDFVDGRPGSEDHRLPKILVGSSIRRRKLRKLLFAKLIGE